MAENIENYKDIHFKGFFEWAYEDLHRCLDSFEWYIQSE